MLDTPTRSIPDETRTDVGAGAAANLPMQNAPGWDARAFANDAQHYVKSHPAQAIAVAALVGFLTAMVIRRR